jgi:hypothetical protein
VQQIYFVVGSLSSYVLSQMLETLLRFCRKMIRHVHILLKVYMYFHVHLFHCSINNVFVNSGIA